MRSQLIDEPVRVSARRGHRLRSAIASLATASLLVSGIAAGVATTAQAAPLQVRGDSDSVQSLVTTVTSNHPNTSSGNENINSLKDRNPSTKWYASDAGEPSTGSPQWAIYTLSNAATVTGYGITSAADSARFPQRDPAAWTVLGSNDAAAASDANHSSWQQIDSRSGQVFAVDNLSRVYAASAPGSYRYFQLRVTAKAASGSNLQIADWTLRSGEAGYSNAIITPDTTWEYLNDPTGTIDPAPGGDRAAWTQVGATLPGTWTNAHAPFGAKRNATNLGSDFPVTTTLPLDRNGTADNVIPAYFFRTTFELNQAALDTINGLYGMLIHDDAVAVYINGEPVVVDHEGSTITENLQYGGGTEGDPRIKSIMIPADALRVGQNVISAEVHNVNATSSDIYFNLPTLNATSDTVPVPFTPEELNASYASDVQPQGIDNPDFFIDQLLNFNEVRQNNPELLSSGNNAPVYTGSSNPRTDNLATGPNGEVAANDRVSVTINNNAAGSSPSQVEKRQQAVSDNSGFTTQRMSNGLGTVLGPIFEDALTTGKLPKTYWLLNSKIEQGRNHEPAKAYYGYKRPFNRMGLVNPSSNPCGGSGALAGTFSGAGRIEPTLGSSYGLCDNGSLPSGHTNHGFAQGTTLATLLPELAPQVMYRASEYANSRIILGYHYPLDVMTGRMAGNATASQRWDDPAMADLLLQARDELDDVLGQLCASQGYSSDVRECAEEGDLISDEDALEIYRERMTYASYLTADGVRHYDGFTKANPEASDLPVIIPDEAPAILLSFFPDLSEDERAAILAATAIDGGWAFDRTKDNRPSWQRLDYAAAMVADVSRATNGDLIVNGVNASDSTLSSITVDGAPLSGFAPGNHVYTVDLTEQGGVLPEIEAASTVPGVDVRVEMPGAAPGAAVIIVTALDGQTTAYTINFTIASAVTTLQSLTVDGVSVPGFSPAVQAYVVELPTGTTTAPVVAAVPTVEGAEVEIEQATSPNGTATVTVKAANGSTAAYVIDFTVKPASGGGDTPGDRPVTAAVSATVQGVTYNKAAKVTVSVQAAGNVPTGRVLVTKGAQSLGSATLSAGSAVVTLPRDLAVGRHTLQVTYVPVASGRVVAPAAPTVITLQVKKAKAKLGKVKVTKGKRNAKTIKRGSKATVRVVLKKVGAAAPTGKVTIRVGKKKVGKAKVKQVGKKYVAKVKTKKVKNKGKVKVKYHGNKTFKKATYKTKLRAR